VQDYDESHVKKDYKAKIKPAEQSTQARETKILNVICNISLVLMSVVTEAFSEMFTQTVKRNDHYHHPASVTQKTPQKTFTKTVSL